MRFFALAALPLALAAPILETRSADTIENKWIVKLKDDADDSIVADVIEKVERLLGVVVGDKFDIGSFKAFSMEKKRGNVLSALLTSVLDGIGAIDYAEPEVKVTTSRLVAQSNPPWGLARISHRNTGSSQYVFDDSAGEGTTAYIIDTGIYTSHNDFDGRASFAVNYAGDGQNTDCNGHGTHVAGTVGSNTYGVAKKTSLVGVKVLNCDGAGSSTGVINGIQYSANQARGKRAVGNLSLGGGYSRAINDAAAAAIQSGLFLAVAAGNEAQDASNSSPASESSVCTVGATDRYDRFASFSNYGSFVDILAPGVNILSTWINGPDDTNVISGTSMATPHVAGLAAYLLAYEGYRAPVSLCQRIKDLATINTITSLQANTANRLAYNGAA